MPFNKDKRIKLPEFLNRVQQRIKTQANSQALAFFEIFVQRDLVQRLVKEEEFQSDLAEVDANAGDFDIFYPFAAQMLHDAASRSFSEVNLDTYQVAHSVSEAMCAELNEYFECSGEDGLFDLIPIKSFIEMTGGADPAVLK